MKYVRFQLMHGLKPASWSLPLKDVLIEKIVAGKSEGLKKVHYVPGVNSFFIEDNRGDLKAVTIWFTKGFIDVPEADKTKIALLKSHPWYNVKYKIYSEEIEAKEELETLRAGAEAVRLIEEAGKDQMKAIALGIFGHGAFNWGPEKAELELRKAAKLDPIKLTTELNSKDYESKYLSALAFNKGIVKENIMKNKVVWNDSSEGKIVDLAVGERGMRKLGEFLSLATEESVLLVQEISNRIQKTETKTTQKDLLSEKDKEIEALRKLLAEKKEADKPVAPSTNGVSKLSIEAAREKYEEKHGKKVPPNKRNDLDWIKSKL